MLARKTISAAIALSALAFPNLRDRIQSRRAERHAPAVSETVTSVQPTPVAPPELMTQPADIAKAPAVVAKPKSGPVRMVWGKICDGNSCHMGWKPDTSATTTKVADKSSNCSCGCGCDNCRCGYQPLQQSNTNTYQRGFRLFGRRR
jgi:hypothetical protein